MNRSFARLLIVVFMGFVAVARAVAPVPQMGETWLESPTPCRQCP